MPTLDLPPDSPMPTPTVPGPSAPGAAPHIIVIGAGIAGLAAACHLARGGAQVTVVERHATQGGRARVLEVDGFRFDMGPSWYWMPDLFERFFAAFGHRIPEFYDLVRLDPSYRIVWPEGEAWDLPAGVPALHAFFEAQEAGAGAALDRFLAETRFLYETALSDHLFRPGLSLREFADPRLALDAVRLRMLRSMAAYARSHFRNERLARVVEWPVLFLGAPATRTPALYALMSYADLALGTWYPQGGMHRIIEAMVKVAQGLGVTFRMNTPVERILVEGGQARGVQTPGGTIPAEAVLAAADYHHVETQLLAPAHRQYSEGWWNRRTMAPSSLLFYLGVKGSYPDLPHHTLFFDRDLDAHMAAVYDRPAWPREPLFYLCHPSATDPTVAPPGHANFFILVPLAPGLADGDAEREATFTRVMDRLEAHVGAPVRERIVLRRDYAMRDFVADYGAFRGNAYGLANTLAQTGPLRPRLRSRKVGGLYFAGQLTVPGPGLPPSLVSGELAARILLEDLVP